MKTSLLLITLTVTLALLTLKPFFPNHNPTLYTQWKSEHRIAFNTDIQDFYRQQIFNQNLQKIKKHNAEGHSYQLGLNQFSAMSQKEFVGLFMMGEMGRKVVLEGMGRREVEVGLEVDWVQKGAVGPVKNSGSMCAASYAVASVGALQSLRKIKGGQLKGLSQQEIIDCSGKYGNYGCNSGLPVNTYKYVVDHGISDESEYPYTGTAKTCQTQHGTFRISAYAQAKNCQDLEQALMKQPVSVLVDASNWMMYRSGIFNNCAGNTLNLAVLLVGMTDTYWKVRNQWGASWGEQGYIRLAMGNCCGICSMASAPLK